MMGMSGVELMCILALALILLGPDQLPSVAKTIGKGLREIRKATEDLKSTFEQEMVKLEDDAPPKLGPGPHLKSPPPADPASARASARSAALLPPPKGPADPASARAAARLAAARGPVAPGGAAVKLLPAEGTIAREVASAGQLTPVSPELLQSGPAEPARAEPAPTDELKA